MIVRARRDRGAAEALGLVLFAPFAVGLALLVVALGRSVESEAQMRTAAEAGAQAAALERTQTDAEAAARRVVDAMLVNDLTCPDHDGRVRVPVDASRGVGLNAGLVEVVVTCVASDRGIERVAEPVERSVTAYATVDRFRASGGD